MQEQFLPFVTIFSNVMLSAAEEVKTSIYGVKGYISLVEYHDQQYKGRVKTFRPGEIIGFPYIHIVKI